MAEQGIRKIAICDDEPLLRDGLARVLRGGGYEVHTAGDGIEVCEVAEAVRPDALVLDIWLPRRDGFAVLVHLRGLPHFATVPIFMMSAEPKETQEEVAKALGASRYFQKPCPFEDVLAAINEALGAN